MTDTKCHWTEVDGRQLGKFDANGLVAYQCSLCDYTTSVSWPDSSLLNEARRQHSRDKHMTTAATEEIL